jgi:hypothetical protein
VAGADGREITLRVAITHNGKGCTSDACLLLLPPAPASCSCLLPPAPASCPPAPNSGDKAEALRVRQIIDDRIRDSPGKIAAHSCGVCPGVQKSVNRRNVDEFNLNHAGAAVAA